MKFKHFCALGIAALCLGTAAGCSSEPVAVSGDYTAYLVNDDWGCGINQIVLSLDHELDAVSKDTFHVSETKEFFDWQKPEQGYAEVTSDRTVLDSYLSDAEGNKTEGASKYVTLSLAFTPTEGSYFLLSKDSPYNLYPELYDLNISIADGQSIQSNGQQVSSLTIAPQIARRVTTADAFQTASYTAQDGVSYNYAYYEPEEKSDLLIVWLHGLCEGGTERTDPYVTCLSSEVPALIGEDFQNTLGGANILVPQCPSFWMDTTGHDQLVNGAIVSDGTSYYTQSLHELIAAYREQTGSSRVIIAGCSNGGFMGMRLAMDYGSEYDAYMLLCEAMEDRFITDADIEALKDLPLYFVYSKDDPTVIPENYEIPTIARLRAAGASNLHVTVYDSILDTTGRFQDDAGNAHNFGGHNAWIPFFNNEVVCDDCGQSAWQWMQAQV